MILGISSIKKSMPDSIGDKRVPECRKKLSFYKIKLTESALPGFY
jgi:hypothetical protein